MRPRRRASDEKCLWDVCGIWRLTRDGRLVGNRVELAIGTYREGKARGELSRAVALSRVWRM